jgi:hypothetical protein
MSPTGMWRVWVTEADIRAAREAWVTARDAGAPADRVLDLLQELERLTRTAVLQSAGDPSATGRDAVARRVPSFTARRFLRPPARLSAVG